MTSFDTILAETRHALAAMDGAAAVADHPILARMAAVIALTHCGLRVDTVTDSTKPKITTTPDASGTECGRALAAVIEETIAARFTAKGDPILRDALGLSQAGALTTAMLAAGATGPQATSLFEIGAEALQELGRRVLTHTESFIRAVMERDLGLLGRVPTHRVNAACNWSLCHPLDGSAARRDVVKRRLQALGAYGAVSSLLMEDDLTTAIDSGRELAPLLTARLGIDRARLAHLNGTLSTEEALLAWQDKTGVVKKLVLHDVPAHRWKAELRNSAWERHDAPLEPRYVPDATCRDALSSFMRDLVRPLASARVDALGLAREDRARRFLRDMKVDAARPVAEQTAWFKAVGDALLNGRGPKAFAEAAAKWHRRVASISALRLEHAAPTPGWPALFAPWTSEDGRATITAITTAEGLVDEGNVMQHCVGGYYSECRTGRTHILSYAVDGRRIATLELLVKAGGGQLSVKQGQFEGLKRADPGPEAHDHVRAMLAQVAAGRHKVDIGLHARFAAERAREYEYDGGAAMPIEFVRKVWPLYRSLMPRGTPDTFDEWAATTPLAAAVDRIVSHDADERRRAA